MKMENKKCSFAACWFVVSRFILVCVFGGYWWDIFWGYFEFDENFRVNHF
jgi:hypothetical protein